MGGTRRELVASSRDARPRAARDGQIWPVPGAGEECFNGGLSVGLRTNTRSESFSRGFKCYLFLKNPDYSIIKLQKPNISLENHYSLGRIQF